MSPGRRARRQTRCEKQWSCCRSDRSWSTIRRGCQIQARWDQSGSKRPKKSCAGLTWRSLWWTQGCGRKGNLTERLPKSWSAPCFPVSRSRAFPVWLLPIKWTQFRRNTAGHWPGRSRSRSWWTGKRCFHIAAWTRCPAGEWKVFGSGSRSLGKKRPRKNAWWATCCHRATLFCL